MATDCAGCCESEGCPCVKACDETFCARHGQEEAQRWARHFGFCEGMTRAERQALLEAFAPSGLEVES